MTGLSRQQLDRKLAMKNEQRKLSAYNQKIIDKNKSKVVQKALMDLVQFNRNSIMQ